ncbi:MAG: zinc-ribbon domain-containing protein [Methanobacteriaceae archaeon]|nr:zinc-ribbon domain-containing protein [Methanobacteriaceae archaeon]
MFCPNCGKENPDNAIFCSDCGNKIEKILENSETTSEDRLSTGKSDTIIDRNREFDKRNNMFFIISLLGFFILIANYIFFGRSFIITIIAAIIIIFGFAIMRTSN